MNSRILKNALKLIQSTDTWCKGARAKTAGGQEVRVMSKAAACFCSKGALLRVAGSESADISGPERFFSMKGNKGNPLGLNYIGFNELRTHDQVLHMWTEALRLAEDEEARGGPPSSRDVMEQVFAGIGADVGPTEGRR